MEFMITSYDEFLNLFPDKPRGRAGNGVLVLCPAHNDHNPSLWIRPSDNPDFVATWDCQAGSCDREKVLQALHLTWNDVRRNGSPKNRGSTIGQPRNSETPPQNSIENSVSHPPQQSETPETGLTLKNLAEAKHLPVDFLKSLGIIEAKSGGKPIVKIPYYSEEGTEMAIRSRLALSGDCRFKWRKGDHPLPYGLNKLTLARKAGWILVVEGESDCWTAWHNGIPAIGAPGKSIWPLEWGKYLQDIDVFLWQEPDAQDFTLRVLESAPGLRFIPALGGIKDISEAHIQGIKLPEWLEGMKTKAESGQELKTRLVAVELAAAYESARSVIESSDPLEFIKNAIRDLGYGGDVKPALVTYLATTSRLLEMRPGAMPVHQILIGPPSAGKSYTLSMVLKLLPSEAFHVIDAGSPRVLIYDDSDLRHKAVIFSEADSIPAGEDNPAASAIRNLLQDHHLHYVVTVRDPQTGEYTVCEKDKPGPTVLITTAVKSLGAQLMTRLFTLEISDSESQIKAALEAQAKLEVEGLKTPDRCLQSFQLYLQFKAPIKVLIPFAREMGEAMKKMAAAPRILRDFARLMSLIKSVALIRLHHRQIDSRGQILATIDDYRTVRELVNDMYIDSSSGVTTEIRQLVEGLIKLHTDRKAGEKITASKLKDHLGISKVAVSRRVNKAIKNEWVINQEIRKGYPSDYMPGEPMPKTEGLPTMEDLNYSPVSGVSSEAETVPEPKLASKREADQGCFTVSPLTDGETRISKSVEEDNPTKNISDVESKDWGEI
jgi:hypothetical protein